ncbi:hypothetical protein JCM8097_002536 [Rhodosporidiobolus ruineniae]
MPHVLEVARLVARKAKQTPADKLEKARQKAASLHLVNVYTWILAGVVGLFVLRNLLLQTQLFIARRRAAKRDRTAASEKSSDKGAGSVLYGEKPVLLRVSDSVDRFFTRPLVGDWTVIRFVLVIGFIALNVGFCLKTSVTLITPNSAGSSLPRAFSRRCGRIAVATYPWLFMFAGRNNIISKLTGFSYQETRFYHILFGAMSFVLSFIHTFAYIAHFTLYQGMEALAEDYTELYFKMGIAALIFLFLNCLFGLKWIRRRSYEIFLLLHIAGAAIILAGSWYHRPIIQDWVYATVAIWLFERLTRIVFHVSSLVKSRFIVRSPVVRARATVSNGAIKLSVPWTGGDWHPGAHAYLSFWGLDLFRRPWLYGQAHPFSIVNVPSENSSEQQELRFVLRIHQGLTRELAKHIERKSAAKGSGEATAELLVSLEGPHGSSARAEEFDSVLLVAGGSGITHPTGILADVCRQAAAGTAVTSNVKLVWAVQKQEQTAWVQETLTQARSQAEQANLPLSVDLYVTRSASPNSSGTSTPTTTSAGLDEKAFDFGEASDFAGGKARKFAGRPDIQQKVEKALADSAGRTLIVACGPAALTDEVRRVTLPYLSSAVEVEIAKFEC